MYKFMLTYSDTDDGNKEYVGTWDRPDAAARYAAKNLKDKKWIVEQIFLVTE